MSNAGQGRPTEPSAVSSPNITATPDGSPAATGNAIREVDFKNFTYPWYPSAHAFGGDQRRIKLRAGEMKVESANNLDRLSARLANVSYADLTGDGAEEAIVTIITNFDPNDSAGCIFLYTVEGSKPTLLWQHEIGGRANGGLRSIRVQGRDLVVEQYDIKFNESEGRYEDGAALCCPKRYTRTRYPMQGERLQRVTSETFPNEFQNARFLGYPSGAQ